jgi:hypothetical protein
MNWKHWLLLAVVVAAVWWSAGPVLGALSAAALGGMVVGWVIGFLDGVGETTQAFMRRYGTELQAIEQARELQAKQEASTWN